MDLFKTRVSFSDGRTCSLNSVTLSISFDRRGETDRLLTPIRGMPASSFGERCMVVSLEDAEGRRTPLPGLSAHFTRPKRPHATPKGAFLGRADRSTAHFLGVLVDTGASLMGNFEQRCPS